MNGVDRSHLIAGYKPGCIIETTVGHLYGLLECMVAIPNMDNGFKI